ncbi:HNH endonuclease family protein [Streptomyces rectiverticillatus]|uniref:HNH endonuclease family protein n=1 Tax=Streptomyces rectiverticillatus TaxID=173860 RepID=UPI003CCDB507
MIPRIRWRRAATAAALCLSAVLAPAVLPASAAPPSAPRDLPEPPAVSAARVELADLTVEAPHSMAGYSRAKFPHWIKQMGTCDTREMVLSRDGRDVKTDDQCRAASGHWHSAYDGKDFTAAGQLDIDHMVPLANAWRSGADAWKTDRRKQFANDLVNPQLVAVSAASNRAKGDQSPDQWRPPLNSYWCAYSRSWTHIKHQYQLSVTQSEQDTLTAMLDTCDQ